MAQTMIDRTGANALIPEPITREIIQGAIAQSAVLSMGRRLPNMSSKTQTLNVLDMLPMSYWVDGDSGFKETSKQAWDKKKIYAEELAVIIPIPEAVLADADYDIWSEVRPRIVEAMGKRIDDAILFGVNKPSTWRNGILQTATAANMTVAEGTDLYQSLLGVGGAFSLVENSGFDVTGVMANVGMKAKLRGLTDTTKRPIFTADMHETNKYTLDGVAMEFPKNGSFDASKALAIVGDFSQLTYAIRQDVTYKILTEATIVDPSTKAVVYSLAQQDMVALRAVMRLGWEIPNPINAFNASNNNRCPFAVLTPNP